MKSAVPEPTIQTYAPNRYLCQKTSEKPELDGRLDKSFWEQAPWSEAFVDIEGEMRPLPHKQTRVKMLWDDEYFYFGAELIEDEIWATLTERDSVIFHDNDFEIFIDPDGDTHHYYEFETAKPYPEDNWVWSPQGVINMHYPELWGYVFFTDTENQPLPMIPEDEEKKWQLRKIYYWERNYFAEHDSFTTDISDELHEQLPVDWEIETTSRTFLASVKTTDGQKRMYIREDGRVWEESAK
ncbi:hypothetical protein J2Z23_003077 [Lederbergia galactosidilyticus]|uniref:carbohydrate-binding family 9-like protein n=1 Tax=Lederbergia galactosidilytica TaxID=217031 RepID=UPI001DF03A97|nr:carbohydrate-binding family 9-like protein [Lederbergia galactosidilytica]MBP1916095.1 hypothetical protein [Lederbergia galactosidilytica]